MQSIRSCYCAGGLFDFDASVDLQARETVNEEDVMTAIQLGLGFRV